MLHSTDTKKLNKKEGPVKNVRISLRRGNKIVIGGRWREETGWERGWGKEWGGFRIRYGARDRREGQRAGGPGEWMENCSSQGWGKRGDWKGSQESRELSLVETQQ